MPNKLQVEIGFAIRSARPRLVAEPLERGFGVTLGNALRRVLLSSLQGAAVTAVQIDGVLHEFSSLAGVREDVTDIVLNIKATRAQDAGRGPQAHDPEGDGPRCRDRRRHPATVGDIEVLNPEHVICTLDEGAEIRMEFTVNNGKGYVAGRAEPSGRRPDRPDPGRQPVSRRSSASPIASSRPARASRWTMTS